MALLLTNAFVCESSPPAHCCDHQLASSSRYVDDAVTSLAPADCLPSLYLIIILCSPWGVKLLRVDATLRKLGACVRTNALASIHCNILHVTYGCMRYLQEIGGRGGGGVCHDRSTIFKCRVIVSHQVMLWCDVCV